ncbi:MAG: hypothetical protein WD970_00130 [Patescibacteria group bacterium]
MAANSTREDFYKDLDKARHRRGISGIIIAGLLMLAGLALLAYLFLLN